jgi:chromosome segregation ATPase
MAKSRSERAGVKEVRQRIKDLRREINQYVTRREGLLNRRDDILAKMERAGGRRGRGRPASGTPAKTREMTDLEKALSAVNKGLDYYSRVQSNALNKLHELERRIIARPRQG